MTIQTFVAHIVQQDEVAAVMDELMDVQFLSWEHCVTVMTFVIGHAQKIVAQTSGASVWAWSLL
jgi:hypothetical protein